MKRFRNYPNCLHYRYEIFQQICWTILELVLLAVSFFLDHKLSIVIFWHWSVMIEHKSFWKSVNKFFFEIKELHVQFAYNKRVCTDWLLPSDTIARSLDIHLNNCNWAQRIIFFENKNKREIKQLFGCTKIKGTIFLKENLVFSSFFHGFNCPTRFGSNVEIKLKFKFHSYEDLSWFQKIDNEYFSFSAGLVQYDVLTVSKVQLHLLKNRFKILNKLIKHIIYAIYRALKPDSFTSFNEKFIY